MFLTEWPKPNVGSGGMASASRKPSVLSSIIVASIVFPLCEHGACVGVNFLFGLIISDIKLIWMVGRYH